MGSALPRTKPNKRGGIVIKTTPMTFNSEMVRALLVGNKTQTRRPVADWQLPKDISPQEGYDNLKYMSVAQRGRYGFGVFGATAEEAMSNYNGEYSGINPFGGIGDLIYVRETWFQEGYHSCWQEMEPEDVVWNGGRNVKYFASDLVNTAMVFGMTGWRKRPSIHMPRWASRLTLKIIDVRVERIQSISEDDAKKEGFTRSGRMSSRIKFGGVWQAIYGDSWNKNEWVWVIDFEVIHKNIDLVLAEMEQAE
jgi:hypothetical protein